MTPRQLWQGLALLAFAVLALAVVEALTGETPPPRPRTLVGARGDATQRRIEACRARIDAGRLELDALEEPLVLRRLSRELPSEVDP